MVVSRLIERRCSCFVAGRGRILVHVVSVGERRLVQHLLFRLIDCLLFISYFSAWCILISISESIVHYVQLVRCPAWHHSLILQSWAFSWIADFSCFLSLDGLRGGFRVMVLSCDLDDLFLRDRHGVVCCVMGWGVVVMAMRMVVVGACARVLRGWALAFTVGVWWWALSGFWAHLMLPYQEVQCVLYCMRLLRVWKWVRVLHVFIQLLQ